MLTSRGDGADMHVRKALYAPRRELLSRRPSQAELSLRMGLTRAPSKRLAAARDAERVRGGGRHVACERRGVAGGWGRQLDPTRRPVTWHTTGW